MIGTMALIVLFLVLVAGVGVLFLRRLEYRPELVPREVRVEDPEHHPEA